MEDQKICSRFLRPMFLFLLLSGTCALCSWRIITAETAKKTSECLVCGELHESSRFSVEYKGNKYYLCSDACLRQFQEHQRAGMLDSVTARIEPRAALFQEDSNPKEPLSQIFFIAGAYLLLGLLFGGVASYIAVEKGLGAWSAFALGLLLNIAGLVIIWLQPKREMQFTSEGLSKIPSTRSESICSTCGHPNHPSAHSCIACGAMLVPLAPSEVEIAGVRKQA